MLERLVALQTQSLTWMTSQTLRLLMGNLWIMIMFSKPYIYAFSTIFSWTEVVGSLGFTFIGKNDPNILTDKSK